VSQNALVVIWVSIFDAMTKQDQTASQAGAVTMPIIEGPLDLVRVCYDPRLSAQTPLRRVGYFSTSSRAQVLDIIIDWSPDDGDYWDTAVIVVLANPARYTQNTIGLQVRTFFVLPNDALIRPNQEWFEHSTNEEWVHNTTLVPGFYIPKTWHFTFNANGPERHSTADNLQDVFREDGEEDWVIYVGVVATEVVYGEEPYESGRVAVSGNITVTLARCICEPLVTEVVRRFQSNNTGHHT
jgi:hypothetical protein